MNDKIYRKVMNKKVKEDLSTIIEVLKLIVSMVGLFL